MIASLGLVTGDMGAVAKTAAGNELANLIYAPNTNSGLFTGDPEAALTTLGLPSWEAFAISRGFSSYAEMVTTWYGGNDPGTAYISATLGYLKPGSLANTDWSNADLSDAIINDPYILCGKNLSTIQGLTTSGFQHLDPSYGLFQTKLPAMDLTGWVPTGDMIGQADLSKTTGLASASVFLKDVTSLAETKLPDNYNLSGWVPTGYTLQGADLSNTTGLSVSTLASVTTLSGTKLPAADLTGWTPSGNLLYNTDLSLCSGLTVASFINNPSLQGVKLPSMDLTGWTPSSNQIIGTDLTKTTGLTVASLTNVTSFNTTKLPAMDLTGFIATGERIRGADLSLTTGLSAAAIANTTSLYQTKLPTMDLTGFIASGDKIRGADLSNTTGLTMAAFTGTTSLENTILPAINLTGWVPTGTKANGTDLSKTTGLTANSFRSVAAYGLYGTKLPPGITSAQLISAGLTAAQRSGVIYTP